MRKIDANKRVTKVWTNKQYSKSKLSNVRGLYIQKKMLTRYKISLVVKREGKGGEVMG